MQFTAGYPAPNPQNEVTIVGVVDDIRQKSVERRSRAGVLHVADAGADPAPDDGRRDVADDPTPLLAAIRDEVRKVDPQIAVDFELVTDSSARRSAGSSSA